MTDAKKDQERRRSPRLEKINLVQVSRFDEEGFRADLATGRTLDISRGGVRIELHHPLPLRSVVSLNLALENRLLDISGEVVYLEVLDDDSCAMGIKFVDLSDDSRRQIDRFLDETED